MESSLVIDLKIACVDTGYFCWTNPCRKFSNLIWESPKMNSQSYTMVGKCNTLGVCHQLSNGFELKHDM